MTSGAPLIGEQPAAPQQAPIVETPQPVEQPTEVGAVTAPTAANPVTKPRRRRLRRFIIFLVVVALLVAAGYTVYRMLMGPSEGTIMNAVSDAPPAVPEVQLEQFDGVNFSFAHPSVYVLRPDKTGVNNNPNSLESYNFVQSGMVSKLLSMSVTKLASGKLEDDSSYYMRSLHPDLYTLKPQTILGDKVVVALDTKSYQVAAFWPHGGKLLTFTVSSISMDTGTTNAEYQKMLESVRWR